jgi:hypothetical protein
MQGFLVHNLLYQICAAPGVEGWSSEFQVLYQLIVLLGARE